MDWLNQVHVGDCRELLDAMWLDGVRAQMCVTSPPYYGLRDYGHEGQIGLEGSLADYLDKIVEVFEGVRRVLADDGTLWLNLGDSFSSSGGAGWQGKDGQRSGRRFTLQRDAVMRSATRTPATGLKPKDLMGQPWRVAFALQEAGWYLRRDIIWHKPNPMPESVRDRPTTAHEYIFLLSKSDRYFYDAAAIAEPTTGGAHSRGGGVNPKASGPPVSGWANGPVSHSAKDHAKPRGEPELSKFPPTRAKQNASFSAAVTDVVQERSARSVWTIPSEPTSFAHFACFPRALPKRCILAGSRPGDVVLDPFMGSGTTAEVALSLGRQFIGCEINAEYAALFPSNRSQQRGLDL